MSAPRPLTHGPEAVRRGRAPRPVPAPTPEAAVPWAVGTLMVTVPAPARDAEHVLAAAAAQAGLPEPALAAAMLAAARGTPVPARAERALRQAVLAARTRGPGGAPAAAGPPLMPLRRDAEQALGRFFEARVRLTAAPADEAARRTFEDSLFTLCVLMAEPSAVLAVRAALQYTEG